jgi:hypothetical protein
LLCRPILKKWRDGAAKNYYFALFWGFVLGFAMLVENQNILRTYVWTHIALMSGVILVLRGRKPSETKDFILSGKDRILWSAKRLVGLLENVIGRYPKKANPALLWRQSMQ